MALKQHVQDRWFLTLVSMQAWQKLTLFNNI
jgi:hypothetical protein